MAAMRTRRETYKDGGGVGGVGCGLGSSITGCFGAGWLCELVWEWKVCRETYVMLSSGQEEEGVYVSGNCCRSLRITEHAVLHRQDGLLLVDGLILTKISRDRQCTKERVVMSNVCDKVLCLLEMSFALSYGSPVLLGDNCIREHQLHHPSIIKLNHHSVGVSWLSVKYTMPMCFQDLLQLYEL